MPPIAVRTRSSRAVTILWAAVLATIAYFLVHNVPRYLTWSAASYGHYFWPRASVLLPHILSAGVAIVVGPLQFWSRIRNRHRLLHRTCGRVYLIAVGVGATSAARLALTSGVNFPYAAGMATFATIWLATSGMGYVAILRRKVEQHRQWMARSYVVTFGFVTLRLAQAPLAYSGISRVDAVTTLSWACWVIPLFIAELAMQGRTILAADDKRFEA